ncbi:NHLP bacteriocin system secretion protein [Pelotomaculum terephthalicicum JT]|uniref:NHLP bacteriocin system secretion protein n=1 Tax=Pelotomaculum TaxID=191373 RepID=UPI0009C5E0A5|nr:MULTISPECIES: NHLP bacteriocin system secretion protein [Pelotomaculum]MCG9966575.1 NHLP bacteriocin system secretion protein [Pelotomaculum terephthalicicum JT]OPX92339.1 MAG: putative efflux pump membrane fusion protein [Pelotomaculum sp. PtaB.Bin117]OPY63513.1 MAG: putative efflux pump membrane fusion protein [Pelotomaculum sp. PtaU1.Bin065]
MSGGIFRKVSLERLSSPEQLDQLFSVTTPRAWYALIAIGCILATSLLWGILGRVPLKVNGQGIIIKSFGMYNIAHPAGGQISDLRVSVGDVVKRGDVVARIEQPDLVTQINDLKAGLERLKKLEVSDANPNEGDLGSDLSDLYDLIRRIKEARSSLPYEEANYKSAVSGRQYEIESAKISLEQARVNEKNKQDYVDKLDNLYKNGAVTEIELTNARKDLELARLEVRTAEEELAKLSAGEWQETIITYKEKLQQAQLNVQLLEEQFVTTKAMKIVETEKKISQLQDDLNLKTEVVSRVDGRVLEVQARKGDMIAPGANLVSLERMGNTINLEVVLYVKAEEGKNIKPGMEAQISPSTVKKEEYGFMLGRVVSVSEYPATAQGMMTSLGSRELVSRLSEEGSPLEVHIDVITDESTVSGYKWSSSKGPPLKINSGTFCAGTVSVSERRPISMVVPMAKKALSIY